MAAQWETLLASAGVAASTTLLIEFAAKPWLELRKDRLLRRDRFREETFAQAVALYAQLETAVPWIRGGTRETVPLAQEIEDRIAEIRGRGYDALPRMSKPVQLLLVYALGVTAGYIHVHLEVFQAAEQRDVEKLTKLIPDGEIFSELGKSEKEAVLDRLLGGRAEQLAAGFERLRRNMTIPMAYAQTRRSNLIRRGLLSRDARRIRAAEKPLQELQRWRYRSLVQRLLGRCRSVLQRSLAADRTESSAPVQAGRAATTDRSSRSAAVVDAGQQEP
ncbi:hypothetical protein [Micromonospora sp. NPDC048063]|uniref:hypothetical protein n=1 Tax=Micromonospora sp. NPDC048063 TaxID=3364256 RepID=UPI00371AE1E0